MVPTSEQPQVNSEEPIQDPFASGKSKKKHCLHKVVLGVFVLVFLCVALQQRLTLRHYTLDTDKEGTVRLAVLADLHSSFYGDEQEQLVEALKRENPDVVLLVGDIADDEVPHEGTKILLEQIGKTYPCYYVSGNHEFWSEDIENIKAMIASYGVTILVGEAVLVTLENGMKIQICGVDDPDGFPAKKGSLAPKKWMEQFEACQAAQEEDVFSILLSHRPELTELYRDSGFDLVVCGHAHGGQWRIPGILEGVYAPNMGLFPKYAGGVYELGETTMVVSRGLCKNALPRMFNPPELVIIDVK